MLTKILVSRKEKYAKYNSLKYFIGYNDNDMKIKTLKYFIGYNDNDVKIKTLTYFIGYNDYENKNKNTITMSLKVKEKKLFKNYNICEKIEKLMKIDLNTKPTYGNDDKYVKTKIKTYEDNITTDFYNEKGPKKVPKEKIPHKFLWIIILDSVLYAYKKYHPQIFLEERKYVEENIKTKNYIDKELKLESDSNSDSASDSDSDSESNTNNGE